MSSKNYECQLFVSRVDARKSSRELERVYAAKSKLLIVPPWKVVLMVGAVRRYEKNFALHRAHTEDRINLLSSRMNDLSLVVSDTNQTASGIVGLVLSIPETIAQFVQSLLAVPGLVLRRGVRILLGGKGQVVDKGSMSKLGKGKGVKSPVKRRA